MRNSTFCNGEVKINSAVCYVTGYLSLSKSIVSVVLILLSVGISEDFTLTVYMCYVTVDTNLLTVLLILSFAEMVFSPLLITGLSKKHPQFLLPWWLLYAAYEGIVVFLMYQTWHEPTRSYPSFDHTLSAEEYDARIRFTLILVTIFLVQLFLMANVIVRAISMKNASSNVRSSSIITSHHQQQQRIVHHVPQQRSSSMRDSPPSYEECVVVNTFSSAQCPGSISITRGRLRSQGTVAETPPPSYNNCSFAFTKSS